MRKTRHHWIILRQQTALDHTPAYQLNNLIPLNILRKSDHQYVVSPPGPSFESPAPSVPKTWQHYTEQLSPWEKRILRDNDSHKKSSGTQYLTMGYGGMSFVMEVIYCTQLHMLG